MFPLSGAWERATKVLEIIIGILAIGFTIFGLVIAVMYVQTYVSRERPSPHEMRWVDPFPLGARSSADSDPAGA